jgi:hypothetical protein
MVMSRSAGSGAPRRTLCRAPAATMLLPLSNCKTRKKAGDNSGDFGKNSGSFFRRLFVGKRLHGARSAVVVEARSVIAYRLGDHELKGLRTANMNQEPPESAALSAQRQVAPRGEVLVILRGALGGAVGGVLGFFVFKWLAQQGLYGMMIPGAMIGLGSAVAARGRSLLLGLLCAVAAVLLSVFAEWAVFPFRKDPSFGFFVAHVHDLPPLKLAMMALGAAFAFWLGQGR